MEITNETTINGLTLGEHRELGRAICTMMEKLGKLEEAAPRGAFRMFYRESGNAVDTILDILADELLDAWPSDDDPRGSGLYPYPLFCPDCGEAFMFDQSECEEDVAAAKMGLSEKLQKIAEECDAVAINDVDTFREANVVFGASSAVHEAAHEIESLHRYVDEANDARERAIREKFESDRLDWGLAD